MRLRSIPSLAGRLGVVIGLVLAGSLAVPAAARAATIPLPIDDPFYAVPANVASLANGAIIHSRTVATQTFGLPLPVTAWQVEYKTTDNIGLPTATVTTIMVPLAPWLGQGPRPLVSYQTAEDGAGSRCSPSYALRAGLKGGFDNSAGESAEMALMLAKGWAVMAPDYEDLDSAFLGGYGAGRATLDAVRAAQHFAAAGISAATPTALFGYSGGAYASSIAAQLQPTYAPELHLTGVALGGVVANVEATIEGFSGSFLGGALAMGIAGIERAFPNFNFQQYLNAAAKQDVLAASNDCLSDAATRKPFLSIAQLEAYPGAFQTPAVQSLLLSTSPVGIPGTPAEPVYDYHASSDEFAPLTADRTLMARYCSSGAVVQHVEQPGEHITGLVTFIPGALTFLSQRFAGQPPANTCSTLPAP